MVTSIVTFLKCGVMVKDLKPNVEVGGFKTSHLQTSCTSLLGCLAWLGLIYSPSFIIFLSSLGC